MKKVLFLIMVIALWGKIEAQAPAGTVLWSETWTGGAPGESISEYGFEGTTVFNDAEIVYSCYNGSGTISASSNAGGLSPEYEGSYYLSVDKIPTGDAFCMELNVKRTGSNDQIGVSTSSSYGYSNDIVVETIGNNRFLIYNAYSNSIVFIGHTIGEFYINPEIDISIRGRYIDDIELKVVECVETPTPNIESGTYYQPLDIELTCTTPNAIIHYTLDGSTPDENSPVYVSPIHIASDITINAIAYKNGIPHSAVNTFIYTFSSYDLEIDGIYYSIISLSDLTLCAVGMVDVFSSRLVIPDSVEYNNKTFQVIKVDLHSSCLSVDEIVLPNNLEYLYIPNCNAEELHLNAMKLEGFNNCPRLKRVYIAPNTTYIWDGSFMHNDLDKLVLENSSNELSFNVTPSVFSHSSINTLYCDRNLYRYANRLFEDCVISKVEYGSMVSEVYGDMLKDVKQLTLPTNVDRMIVYYLTNLAALEEITIESKDFMHCDDYSDSYNGYASTRPLLENANNLNYVFTNAEWGGHLFENMRCKQFIIGQDVCRMHYSTNISVEGEGAFVKIYNRIPLEEYPEFTNETYLYTPLYVPRGSLSAYQTAEGWRNFFNIIEFDWTGPIYTITATVNDAEFGSIEGDGTYNYGERVTLIAHSNNGYKFKDWSEDGVEICTNPSYTFVVDRDRNLVANFTPNTGINENEELSKISVYPNPAHGQFTVSGTGKVVISNALGQTIKEMEIDGKQTIELPVGMYFVQVNGSVQKIIVE